MVDVTNRMLFAAHRFKGAKPKPIKINRPTSERADKHRRCTREDFRKALLGG